MSMAAGILDWRELPPEIFVCYVIPTSSNHIAVLWGFRLGSDFLNCK